MQRWLWELGNAEKILEGEIHLVCHRMFCIRPLWLFLPPVAHFSEAIFGNDPLLHRLWHNGEYNVNGELKCYYVALSSILDLSSIPTDSYLNLRRLSFPSHHFRQFHLIHVLVCWLCTTLACLATSCPRVPWGLHALIWLGGYFFTSKRQRVPICPCLWVSLRSYSFPFTECASGLCLMNQVWPWHLSHLGVNTLLFSSASLGIHVTCITIYNHDKRRRYCCLSGL